MNVWFQERGQIMMKFEDLVDKYIDEVVALDVLDAGFPALDTRCAMIVRPAERTTLSALYYAHLAKLAGIPDGMLNVVYGFGQKAGTTICSHMDINKSNQEQNKFEDSSLKDLNDQTLFKCMKLGKLNKVLKDQVNALKCDLKNKTKNTSHKIEALESEKQGLHGKVFLLEKEVNDAKEKMKLTLDELHSAKLDVILSQQKLEKFSHGAMNIDKMLSMGKTDSDKRGLGYKEPLPNAKTPQITKFVKVTTSTLVAKYNMISTTRNHTKRASYS
ncbi:hypothetical protein GIB67_008454 [Kingdonia uniflora]|uniref:Aldehyde dehydrogenase domain-containing protein n=1 Tax=Kingdonia uniflora TaxID=39325 RepID=A0A7J7N599_9MAGN|nr:hypothetical protein GIB67_008454 [Kingdonia uniflora]